VCVDGFIPPRAFQAFQAHGVLPIAADMRSAAQLAYTPAPDIIHEAAGHAPFLAHPDYAEFLRRIGRVGELAFDSPYDRAMYQAIYELSELKQQADGNPRQLELAQRTLNELGHAEHTVSEATLLSRLYWWTVEYGLIGNPADYRLYGAGLLSSIGEGHFCHAPEVEKRVLSADCTAVDYDITRAQPQLFVARDFSHLHEVLAQVEQRLGYVRGGQLALARARESEQLATLSLASGLSVVGKVSHFDASMVYLSGDCALVDAGGQLTQLGTPYCLPLGELDDGTPLDRIQVARLAEPQLSLRTRAGLELRGRVLQVLSADERVLAVHLQDCTITGEHGPLVSAACYTLVLAQQVETASPLVPERFHPTTVGSPLRVPHPRARSQAERTLDDLHARALAALHGRLGADAVPSLQRMHRQLTADFPEEWLLRFNLLEALTRLGESEQPLAYTIERELLQLELRYLHREPIVTGLRSLRSLVAG
jgi:phenylalanine-4-hydroxylase